MDVLLKTIDLMILFKIKTATAFQIDRTIFTNQHQCFPLRTDIRNYPKYRIIGKRNPNQFRKPHNPLNRDSQFLLSRFIHLFK